MIGHQSIIDLRLNGYKPVEIWVMLPNEKPTFGPINDPESMMQNQFKPEVYVMPDESVGSLDFRFVRDITIHIVCIDKNRSMRALKRIAQFDPEKAICAGEDWMFGWTSRRGFINFFEKDLAKDDTNHHSG